jgi:hypothetical protein
MKENITMDDSTKNDIRRLIYENRIEPSTVFEKYLEILEEVSARYSDRATIRTRDEGNKLLHSSQRNYFTFVESGQNKFSVIFAGALEKSPRSAKAPVVRVRNSNQHLTVINAMFKYPFAGERNPEWTNVIISSMTIDALHDILLSEVENYFNHEDLP